MIDFGKLFLADTLAVDSLKGATIRENSLFSPNVAAKDNTAPYTITHPNGAVTAVGITKSTIPKTKNAA